MVQCGMRLSHKPDDLSFDPGTPRDNEKREQSPFHYVVLLSLHSCQGMCELTTPSPYTCTLVK